MFRLLAEPVRRGGEEGGVNGMLRCPDCVRLAKLDVVGVKGVRGVLFILMVIEGLLVMFVLSSWSARGRLEAFLSMSLLPFVPLLEVCCSIQCWMQAIVQSFSVCSAL